jgi:hypothetical protein
MTPPATGTALLILVGFVLPGFVAVLLKERLYDVRGEEATFDRLLTTVYYSLLVYLLPALGFVLLTAVGALGRDDVETLFEGRSSSSRTGAVLPGTTAKRSRSGYGTKTRDLFLQERWGVSPDDGSISRPPAQRRNVGVWIDAGEIRLVNHYALSSG